MIGPARLLESYARGVFPMADSAEDDRLFWVDPPMRGVLPIGGIHASRSLLRDLRRGGWTAHLDCDFDAVVEACAARETTWINGPLRQLYHQLHRAGHAHAIEIRHDGARAGGLFGVTIGGAFFGESMFSTRRSGSRMALLWTSSHLKRCGFRLFDTQFLTPHLASMGGYEIPRPQYHALLREAIALPADFRLHPLPEADQLWQEITQTS
ncbi:leucyl/phenylalanyl-tRNA--protein transferase [Paracoccus bogoriensis]|uniref:leucyl/phenylalanyl-tRNA--protein transferase n=1 Tax=Paracoccus bogoriensis TaxID=242065 RepID=UPI001CA5C0E0|nr:leucyl/phenylalanyl-tRNA--protein transferase [Paracoccus bogoriensis]MBW7055775.1 leucyl/phenylalanyl-tRNA--protein transferase [Paracoccus bogoriensis]